MLLFARMHDVDLLLIKLLLLLDFLLINAGLWVLSYKLLKNWFIRYCGAKLSFLGLTNNRFVSFDEKPLLRILKRPSSPT